MSLDRQRHNRTSNKGFTRIHLLGAFFFLSTLSLLIRLFYIQIWKPDPWRSMAPAQYENRMRLAARRGLIYDRQRYLLAMDMSIYSLAADPTQITDYAKTAGIISSVLGGDDQHYIRLFQKSKETQYVRISDDITEEQKMKLQAMDIKGLIFNRECMRLYPFNTLARPLIGWIDSRHEGVAGVELAFNEILAGQDGWTILQRDGLNRSFSTVDYPVEPALDGKHIVLTLDNVYQTIIEEELRIGIDKYQAKWGSAVLMHPVTGEILAMASMMGPRFSRENSDFQFSIRNRAIQDNYEPGSVFKIVALAACLNEGIYSPESLIFCENGTYLVDGHKIGDDNRSFQWLTVSQAMQVSSNIALSKMVKKLGKDNFYRYVQNFGFGNRTNIGLPNEASGSLRPSYQWDDFFTSTLSFGQGLSVTTLQLACMAAVIANGGDLIQPQIYKEILDKQGRSMDVTRPKVIRHVISQETASQVAEILEGTITHGTGGRAAVPGVRIAGKTGTAQKFVPGAEGYLPGLHVTSFVGFWPVESPEFVLVVTLDEPKPATLSSQNAAPIFARMVQQISGLPDIPPIPESSREPASAVFSLSSYETPQAQDNVQPMINQTISPHFVPNLIGLSVRQALRQCAICGIEVQIEGHGLVRQQDLKPGIRVKENMRCRLICK